MKIVFTGGGTGGHFYPIIAIAEAMNVISSREKLVGVEMFYMSDSPYDERALFENGLTFRQIISGKKRLYFSFKNFIDILKIIIGALVAIWKLFILYPDVVVGKGGYASFPALFAARILRIPVIIHESDAIPGRVNLWISKFAKLIMVSHREAAEYFRVSEDKIIFTGHPIRNSLLYPTSQGAYEFLKLEKDVPVIFVTGGSQGSEKINDVVLDSLFEMVQDYQIIHQTGAANFILAQKRAGLLLEESPHKDRYHPYDFLNVDALRMAGGIADIVVSRAGSAVFEILGWGVPVIVIPIPENISRDQRSNALAFERSGGVVVIEEGNLSPAILMSQVKNILDNSERAGAMSRAAIAYSKQSRGAAGLIAGEIFKLALKHE